MQKARAHVIVTGILKGLFIKSAVKSKARMLSVKGWIRNNTESEMEAVLEGEKQDIDELINFLRNGPNNAVVYNFDLKWEDPKDDMEGFEVKPVTDFHVAIDTRDAKTAKLKD